MNKDMNDFTKMAFFNLACYCIGWALSIFLGIRGYSWTVFFGALILISAQLLYTKQKSPILFIQDIILLPFTTVFGVLMEMIFIQIGVVNYTKGLSHFPPMWIVAFYPLFSLLINHSLMASSRNQLLGFFMGFCCAPFSYMIGGFLGGLAFYYPAFITWTILGLFWGSFIVFMRFIANAIERAAHETFQESKNKNDLKLFYDGDCPICSREVGYLEQKNAQKNMRFIDIVQTEDFNRERGSLDYKTAMSKMHALDDHGHLSVGLDAFAKAYARCGMLVMSTLLNISFLRPVLDPLYALFAKHRRFLTGRDIQD